MNIFWEVIGYIGTVLVIISMMMTSVTKLRIINVCGAMFSTVYAVVCDAWAIVVMNVCLMAINLFHLLREFRQKRANQQQ